MDLIFVNNVTKNQYVITGLTDLCTNALFWEFNIALPEEMKEEGEYSYYLMDGEDVIARGLAQLGNYTPNKEVYNNRTNGYTVYGG